MLRVVWTLSPNHSIILRCQPKLFDSYSLYHDIDLIESTNGSEMNFYLESSELKNDHICQIVKEEVFLLLTGVVCFQKRKATDSNANQSDSGRPFDFDSFQPPPGKTSRGSTEQLGNDNQLHSSVSVNIIHNIDASLNQTQGEIKLTFSSTLNARPSANGSTQPAAGGSGQHCTGAYRDDNLESGLDASATNNPQNSRGESFGMDDVDDLSEFWDHISGQDGNISADILKDFDQELRRFEEGYNAGVGSVPSADFKHSGYRENYGDYVDPSAMDYKVGPVPTNFSDPMCAKSRNMGQTFVPTIGMTGGCPPMAPFTFPKDACIPGGMLPTTALMGDTGPAAETLKQMAAQHQNQEKAQYARYGPTDYRGGFSRCEMYPAPPGYNPKLHSYGYPAPAMGQYISGADCIGKTSQVMPGKNPGFLPPAGYRSTKPLSHYPDMAPASSMPSSLQQLQNQVQSHFGPTAPTFVHPSDGCRLELSQSQHLHVQNGSSRQMRVAGSQQMTMVGACDPSTVVSMSQHQSFNMSTSQFPMKAYPPNPGFETRKQPYASWMPEDYNSNPRWNGNGYCSTDPLRTIQNMVDQTDQAGQMSPQPAGTYTGRNVDRNANCSTQQAQYFQVSRQQQMLYATGGNCPPVGQLPPPAGVLASSFPGNTAYSSTPSGQNYNLYPRESVRMPMNQDRYPPQHPSGGRWNSTSGINSTQLSAEQSAAQPAPGSQYSGPCSTDYSMYAAASQHNGVVMQRQVVSPVMQATSAGGQSNGAIIYSHDPCSPPATMLSNSSSANRFTTPDGGGGGGGGGALVPDCSSLDFLDGAVDCVADIFDSSTQNQTDMSFIEDILSNK